MIELRGGFETSDRRLDRLPEFKPRQLQFLADEGLEDRPLRGYRWAIPGEPLDQGSEGRCVEYAICAELLGRPVKVAPAKVDAILAGKLIYCPAQARDPWPETSCDGGGAEGTSIDAGMMTALELGYFDRFEWAWTEHALALAVGYKGIAVGGFNWYTGCFEPDVDGFIHVTGRVEGGHGIAIRGIRVRMPRRRPVRASEWPHYILRQSWGPMGVDGTGDVLLSRDGMERLLAEGGEAAVPGGRRK